MQADALNKSFFVGEALDDPSDDPEFYWRNYVDGRYVGLLDAARQIGEQLGYGPLGGPEDD